MLVELQVKSAARFIGGQGILNVDRYMINAMIIKAILRL